MSDSSSQNRAPNHNSKKSMSTYSSTTMSNVSRAINDQNDAFVSSDGLASSDSQKSPVTRYHHGDASQVVGARQNASVSYSAQIESQYYAAVMSGVNSLGVDISSTLAQRLTDQQGVASDLASKYEYHGGDAEFLAEDVLLSSDYLGPVPHYVSDHDNSQLGDMVVEHHDLMGVGGQFYST